jgi:hypothetical protein
MTDLQIPDRVLEYGDIVNLQNGYKNWGAGYLDACGAANCGDNLNAVSTSTTPNRNGSGSTAWKVLSASGKPEKSSVLLGDKIHLQNALWVGGECGYLDTCGSANCGDNLNAVSTSRTSDRTGQGTGTWKITPDWARPHRMARRSASMIRSTS